MQITVFKCEFCKELFEQFVEFKKHHDKHLAMEKIRKKYNLPFDKEQKKHDCNFANGDYCYSIPQQNLYSLTKDICDLVVKYYPKFKDASLDSYVVGRTLSDSDDPLYSLLCEWLDICNVCGRVYGQMYFRNNCHHDGTTEHFGKKHECPIKETIYME